TTESAIAATSSVFVAVVRRCRSARRARRSPTVILRRAVTWGLSHYQVAHEGFLLAHYDQCVPKSSRLSEYSCRCTPTYACILASRSGGPFGFSGEVRARHTVSVGTKGARDEDHRGASTAQGLRDGRRGGHVRSAVW